MLRSINLVRLIEKCYELLMTLYLKILGVEYKGKLKIYGKFLLQGDPKKIVIGRGVQINEGVILNARDKIIIGDNVTISARVQIHTGKLDIGSYNNFIKKKHSSASVVIEDNVWIAAGAIISPGVRIGKNSVIGAGSVVTRDIPSNSFAAGVPARVIKKLWEYKEVKS